ncbi:MAG: nitronate monooxygenase [Deltaproteobacteria bacterium]|nr:nitronate monooxygenase [Deltaproteobacteria bacterium]
MSLSPLTIRNSTCTVPIVQGGMGVGVSMAGLAAAVSREGGLGTISSACLDRLVSRRVGRKVDSREAARLEVREAKAAGEFPIAINVMVALDSTYEASVLGAMDGGVDVVVSGAGLPLRLPSVIAGHPRADEVGLVPIVSSVRALRLLCQRWRKAGRMPDAAIVEGPLAGGHLGWKTSTELHDPDNRLENLLEPVLEAASEFGGFPVIAAGGVFTREDVLRTISLGAAGVQMGTRFLATVESGASDEYKRAVVDCTHEAILVAQSPGSPCGLPFRVLTTSPMYRQAVAGGRTPLCDKGYLAYGRAKCAASSDASKYFCICNGLLSSAGYNGDEEAALYTVGANAHRVDRILPVAQLMAELTGETATRGTSNRSALAAAA